MLAPHVSRDALPTCVWERLERLCAVVYAPKQRKGMVWHAEWRRGVVCSMHPPPAGNGDSMATTGDAAVAAGVVAVGTMKPTSTEAENAILLQPDCDGEGDGTRLVEPLPPPGEPMPKPAKAPPKPGKPGGDPYDGGDVVQPPA